MIEQLITNGGAYIGEEVQSKRDFIGRDRISITVEESYLQQIWTRLDADLQDALSLAGNQVLREGGEAIALAHLLRALVRLRPDLVEEILPLLLWYQDPVVTKSTVREIWKERKLMDIDATLQALLRGLLVNHNDNDRLSCEDLLHAFGGGPDHPFPTLLEGNILHQPINNLAAQSNYIASSYVVAGKGSFTGKFPQWHSMHVGAAKGRWN